MTAVLDLRRVLILAAHPDDDVIGAGAIIQRTVAGGGSIRVLFITGGENNTWAQRALLRKLRLTAADRQEWARLRADEARSSLGSLVGSADRCSFFLGYPDRGLWQLARNGDSRLIDDVQRHAREFQPTLVITPSFFDAHPDHQATAWFAHQLFGPGTALATYVVHGRPPLNRTLITLHLTAAEQMKKGDAIRFHRSQLVLSRQRFLAYARSTETLYAPEHDVVRIVSPWEERRAALHHGLLAFIGLAKRLPARFGGDSDEHSIPSWRSL